MLGGEKKEGRQRRRYPTASSQQALLTGSAAARARSVNIVQQEAGMRIAEIHQIELSDHVLAVTVVLLS